MQIITVTLYVLAAYALTVPLAYWRAVYINNRKGRLFNTGTLILLAIVWPWWLVLTIKKYLL